MKHTHIFTALALIAAVGAAGPARAGAPTPDTREGDFKHVCKGGPNKDGACTLATAATDCPKSDCVLTTLSKKIKGKLTIIAHDNVTDWFQGTAGNEALTLMLEVKAPDGTKQMLAATYQDLTLPTNPVQPPFAVVSIPVDELAVKALAADVSGLVFAQPEATLAAQLQTLFSATGTPAIVAVKDKTVQFADHTGDNLATVLRFKVIIQFIDPL